MIIDKIKVVYKLTASYPFKDTKDKLNKNGLWNFQDFLDRYPGTYNITDRVNLNVTQMRKVNSWQDYYKFATDGEQSSLSFFVGRLRTLGEVDGSYCMMEWNPNKCVVPDVCKAFLNYRKAIVHRISSMDVAFDLKDVPLQNICFVAHGSTSTMSIGTVGSSATRYLRPKCKDGRIKVYDKEKEREGAIDAEKYKGVTRVEITYQNVEFFLIDFFKSKSDWCDSSVEIFDLFRKEVYKPYENAYINANKRVSQMLKYLDSVRIFDKFKGCSASQFGLKQYQADMFDAYIEKFGFQNLQVLYNNMAKATQVKYRAYADYLSNMKTRPLFKGCASDYFFALRNMLIEVLPSAVINESDVIAFHKFDDDELPF